MCPEHCGKYAFLAKEAEGRMEKCITRFFLLPRIGLMLPTRMPVLRPNAPLARGANSSMGALTQLLHRLQACEPSTATSPMLTTSKRAVTVRMPLGEIFLVPLPHKARSWKDDFIHLSRVAPHVTIVPLDTTTQLGFPSLHWSKE